MRPWWETLPSFHAPVRTAIALCAATFSLVVAEHAAAQSNLPVPKREEEVLRELEVPLPEYPLSESLLRFPTSWTSNAIFVDPKTLAVADDGVVRFSLVVRSPSGVESVSFEGIRCATGERRVFAYGRKAADVGTWSPARSSAWRPISDSRINRHYFEFLRDVFCDGNATESKREILKNLASGGRPRQLNSPGE